jgi:SsrA-binding protein
MAVQEESGEKLVSTNRKARHEYFVLDSYEVGIVLKGTEVKSLRQGNANLTDGYAQVKNGELWLTGLHISPYAHGSYANVDPLRQRKLLLHKKELRKLVTKLQDKGVTLIPLKMYFTHGIAKLQLGVCKGKKEYDKRQDIAKRDAERAIRRHLAR